MENTNFFPSNEQHRVSEFKQILFCSAQWLSLWQSCHLSWKNRIRVVLVSVKSDHVELMECLDHYGGIVNKGVSWHEDMKWLVTHPTSPSINRRHRNIWGQMALFYEWRRDRGVLSVYVLFIQHWIGPMVTKWSYPVIYQLWGYLYCFRPHLLSLSYFTAACALGSAAKSNRRNTKATSFQHTATS